MFYINPDFNKQNQHPKIKKQIQRTDSKAGLQHETKCKEFKMSQRVPATKKIKESSLKGPSLLFSCVPLPHFER